MLMFCLTIAFVQQDPASQWYTPTQRVIESPGGGGYVILPNSFHIKQNDNKGERAESYFAVNFFET